MEAQRFDPVARKPRALWVVIPPNHRAGFEDEEWQDPLPSPPPPTPSKPRRETPYDAQRYDPFRTMLCPSLPVFPSPTSPEFAIDHPKLSEALTVKFATLSEVEECSEPATHSPDSDDDFDYAFADRSGSSDDSNETELATPGDDHADSTVPFLFDNGAESDDEYEVDRTIIRANARRFDLSRSLAKLSTATLRSVPSLSSVTRQTRDLEMISPSTSDFEDIEMAGGISAPPVSRLISRRPSLVGGSLSSPVSASEVGRSLRRIASSLSFIDRSGFAIEKHFEEDVAYFEKTWPLAECGEHVVQVHIDRSEETVIEKRPLLEDGIGIYAAPRSRKTTLRTVVE